jgi:hypothetical protein
MANKVLGSIEMTQTIVGPVGGTPTGVTGTVALPISHCMVPA